MMTKHHFVSLAVTVMFLAMCLFYVEHIPYYVLAIATAASFTVQIACVVGANKKQKEDDKS